MGATPGRVPLVVGHALVVSLPLHLSTPSTPRGGLSETMPQLSGQSHNEAGSDPAGEWSYSQPPDACRSRRRNGEGCRHLRMYEQHPAGRPALLADFPFKTPGDCPEPCSASPHPPERTPATPG